VTHEGDGAAVDFDRVRVKRQCSTLVEERSKGRAQQEQPECFGRLPPARLEDNARAPSIQ
jgi:hypothetical protein